MLAHVPELTGLAALAASIKVEPPKQGDSSNLPAASITTLEGLTVQEVAALIDAMTQRCKTDGMKGLDAYNQSAYPNVDLKALKDFFPMPPQQDPSPSELNATAKPGYEAALPNWKAFGAVIFERGGL